MKSRNIPAWITVGLLCATTALAKDNIADSIVMQNYGTSLSFTSKGVMSNISVSIAGPKGYSAQKSEQHGMPMVNLTDYGKLHDGLYNYELVVPVGDMVLIKDTIDNGRGENNSIYARKGIRKSGHFWVRNGSIVQFKRIKEPAQY